MSRSGYYKWLNRKPTASEKCLRKLMALILQAYEEHKGIYGYRRITIYLNHFLGAKVNHKLVYRLMKPAHVAENILNREFQKAYQPMEVLLTDVSEFKYGQQSKAYLSAILDYGENKIVAYQLSKKNNNALVRDTVSQIKDQLIPAKTLLHSDRGFQYTSHGFKKFVTENHLIQSMSRVGKCIDNGPMENFWGIIKEEMYRLKNYQTFEDLASDIQRYVAFYNTRRVTLKMGLRIPA